MNIKPTPIQDLPQMYTKAELAQSHPIAMRKAKQRAEAEQRKLTRISLTVGKHTYQPR